MAYKDKEKQRAYQRDWVRQKRGSAGSTKCPGSTDVRPDERTYANAVLCEPVSSGCRGCKLLTYQQGKGLSCPMGEWQTSAQSVFEQHINPNHDCLREGAT